MSTLLAGATIFVSSFLLFQIQPMIAKAILPWFGGSAAVWSTCLMFFQSVLFLGYAYAHVLTSRVPAKRQLWVHGGLIAASLLALPVLPADTWKPMGDEEPGGRILLLLGATAGLPYFLLSSTSPLVQAWYARSSQGALPYRYFALSNFASLAALLGYPTLVEPSVALPSQGILWSAGYLLFAGGTVAIAWVGTQNNTAAVPDSSAPQEILPEPETSPAARPGLGTRLLWTLFAAVASIMSLSVTNHLTQNIAPIPMLWVLPLAIYLITFILCFERDGWYPRTAMLILHGAALAAVAYLGVQAELSMNVRVAIPLLCGALFFICMFCHGELARRKPGAAHLTEFYLMISLGGAIGALLVGLGAPWYLDGSYDLPVALAVCAFFTLMLEYRKGLLTDLAWAAVTVGVTVSSGMQILAYKSPALVMSRSFYGGLRVVEQGERRSLVHGSISHGSQYLDDERRMWATAYYAPGTGVERAIKTLHRPNQYVGVIGLGAGTLAAYGQPGDHYRFYELDPDVIKYAKEYFTFLKDSPAQVETVVGDGRLALQREEQQNFDILVVDAFSGDAIPVHLLSREAMQLYFQHIRPGGVLAFHVSNTSLTLAPVVQKLAQDLDYSAVRLYSQPDESIARSESDWVLVARDAETLNCAEFDEHSQPFLEIAGLKVWTDNYSTLFPILK